MRVAGSSVAPRKQPYSQSLIPGSALAHGRHHSCKSAADDDHIPLREQTPDLQCHFFILSSRFFASGADYGSIDRSAG